MNGLVILGYLVVLGGLVAVPDIAGPIASPPAPVVMDVAPAPRTPAPARTAASAPRVASTPRPAPSATPWMPALIVCPRPLDGQNGEWVLLAPPPICEPEHVYGFVAPPGWKAGDPVPPWRKAP